MQCKEKGYRYGKKQNTHTVNMRKTPQHTSEVILYFIKKTKRKKHILIHQRLYHFQTVGVDSFWQNGSTSNITTEKTPEQVTERKPAK